MYKIQIHFCQMEIKTTTTKCLSLSKNVNGKSTMKFVLKRRPMRFSIWFFSFHFESNSIGFALLNYGINWPRWFQSVFRPSASANDTFVWKIWYFGLNLPRNSCSKTDISIPKYEGTLSQINWISYSYRQPIGANPIFKIPKHFQTKREK